MEILLLNSFILDFTSGVIGFDSLSFILNAGDFSSFVMILDGFFVSKILILKQILLCFLKNLLTLFLEKS